MSETIRTITIAIATVLCFAVVGLTLFKIIEGDNVHRNDLARLRAESARTYIAAGASPVQAECLTMGPWSKAGAVICGAVFVRGIAP